MSEELHVTLLVAAVVLKCLWYLIEIFRMTRKG